jgi:hypothetical protein
MVNASAARTELDAMSIEVEPCILGATDAPDVSPVPKDASSLPLPLPLLAGGGLLLVALGTGAGFVLARRR